MAHHPQQQQQQLPPMPLFPLGHVMHCTVDRMNEDLVELQMSCCTSSDSDRRKKIILYCELERHRALQLMALHHFAEHEAATVEGAIQGVGKELEVRWHKNAASWNPEYASTPDMRAFAAWEAVRMFKSVRAPKYDVQTAVNVLVNRKYSGGFDLLEQNLVLAEEPSVDVLQNRVLSRVLSKEYRLASSSSSHSQEQMMPMDGQITCQSEAYLVKLTLDAEDRWYCTAMRVFVAQAVTDGSSEDRVHISSKWGDVLAAELEKFILHQQEEGAGVSVFDCVHQFMTTFCGSLVLQILERQASSKLAAAASMGVSVVESKVDALHLALPIAGWALRISIRDAGQRFSCVVVQEEEDATLLQHELPVTISLRSVQLASVVENALGEVARFKLEHLRALVLQQSTRHDVSQCRIVKHAAAPSGYQLDLDLFDDDTVLSVTFSSSSNAFAFSTNTRAVRWGQFTVDEFLAVRAKEVGSAATATTAAAAASIVLAVWHEAEAWDCLSLLASAIQAGGSRPSYVSPSFELVPHLSPLPSLFWSLGSYEGLKYVLVCQFKQAPSLFHLKFLDKRKRLEDSAECLLCSIGHKPETGEIGVLELRHEPVRGLLLLGGSDSGAIGSMVTDMRQQWVRKLFHSKFELSPSSGGGEDGTTGAGLWQGSTLSHIQLFEPFKLDFLPVGLRIQCGTGGGGVSKPVSLLLKRTDQADVTFDQELRNMVLLQRLAQRCEHVGTVQQGNQQFVLVWRAPLTGAVRFSINRETLHLQAFCVPTPHPLEEKIAQYCETHPTDTALDLALSMLADSTLVIQAAEQHAKRHNRTFRVSASSVTNVHFMFDSTATAGEERLSFDARFFGRQALIVWNRAGWSHTSAMMSGDVSSVAGLQHVLQ